MASSQSQAARVAINSDQTSKPKKEIESPEEYGSAITTHAGLSLGQSLYAGPNYKLLANHVRRRQQPPSTAQNQNDQATHKPNLAVLHDLNRPDKDKVQRYHDVRELETALKLKQTEDSPALVLFLNGYLPAEWILHIGWLCNVDPEFWLRHLDFRASSSDPAYFTTPALPSSVGNIIRLRIPSIGHRQSNVRRDQVEVQKLRKASQDEMDKYISQIKKDKPVLSGERCLQPGDSIVRSFALHDQEHCSLEQDMTLCVNKFGAGSTGWVAVIWSDFGTDLSEGIRGPWTSTLLRSRSWQLSINPTVMHIPRIALKTPYMGRQEVSRGSLTQSASAIPVNYGRLHDYKLAGQDAFYALNEIFTFSAVAESQFLNMVEQKINVEMVQDGLGQETRGESTNLEKGIHEERHAWTFSNLLYIKNLLDDHVRRLKELVSSVEGGPDPKWPRAVDEYQQNKATVASDTLVRDYKYLLERAQTLSDTCDRGIDIAGNNAMIAESKVAAEQARKVNKLTLLAFFFIPASFTTSLFGMNFHQFGQGPLSIWIWVVVLVPTYIVSLFVLYTEPKKEWERVKRFAARKHAVASKLA